MSFYRRSENTTIIPSPVVLQPSDFGGNDGRWTTFIINLGSGGSDYAGQDFRVLISTSSDLTIVPDQADWCTVPTQQECANARGIQPFQSSQSLGFDAGSSKSWQLYGTYNLPLSQFLGIAWTPDANPNATYGLENVGLGPSSPQSMILQNRPVAKVHTKDLFMGSFGLSIYALNPGNGPLPSPFLAQFSDDKQIPSRSYSYTAGASYRNNSKGVPGSVVLGGLDESRFTDKGTSINFPATNNQTLVVGVQDIHYAPNKNVDTNEYSMMNHTNGFYAVVDSTLPYLFLPKPICDYFEEKFQLDYDSTANMYWVSDSAHDHNTNFGGTVTFKIGKDTGSREFTSITLPYAAFDLTAGFPLNGFSNTTGRRYFPIKQSSTGIFVLGRTFLQEAYLTVDYERGNFSIAPAIFSDPMPASRIVPIFNTSYVTPHSSSSSSPGGGSGGGGGGISPGVIAGIVVGIVVAFLLGALVAFLFWKKKRGKKADDQKPPEIDTVMAGDQIRPRRISELDAKTPGSPEYYAQHDRKGVEPFPPLEEITYELDSPPVELPSPPQASSISGRTEGDYFPPQRRNATRESSGKNTPGISEGPHELSADSGVMRSPDISPLHTRAPSNATAQTGIDTVVTGPDPDAPARRPSQHIRGPSDAPTESTAVSEPTAEQREAWARDDGPRRPLSE